MDLTISGRESLTLSRTRPTALQTEFQAELHTSVAACGAFGQDWQKHRILQQCFWYYFSHFYSKWQDVVHWHFKNIFESSYVVLNGTRDLKDIIERSYVVQNGTRDLKDVLERSYVVRNGIRACGGVVGGWYVVLCSFVQRQGPKPALGALPEHSAHIQQAGQMTQTIYGYLPSTVLL